MCHADIASSVAANPGEVVNFYSITYDANGSTAGITPVMQAAESSRESYYFALDEGKDLRKNGYSFIGWAEDKDAVDPKYIAGSTIALTIDKPAKTLYAVWRIDKAWNNITKMQELTPNTCRGLALEASKQLIDERDNKSYWVTRLADGNCWMTQNLDYEPENAIKYVTPNNPDAWPDTYSGVARYYDPGEYYKIDTDDWSGCDEIEDGFSNAACTATGWKTAVANEEEKHFHVGNFYNWYAATNGSWKDVNTIEASASDSICPSGWQLPKGGMDASGSYGTPLLVANEVTTDLRSLAGIYKIGRNSTSSTLLRQSPLYFLPGGYVSSGHLRYAGSTVQYWSSTILDSATAYGFVFSSADAYAVLGFGYFLGFSVRCLVPSL